MSASRRTALTASAAAVLALGLAPLAGAGPVAAQVVPGCADGGTVAERLATAPVAFTGTVAAVSDRARVATVDVIKVWKGGPLPRRVEVRGTIATQAKVTTALDRIYAKDRLYLFVPTSGTTPRFIENQCSATQSFSSALVPLAPPGGGDAPTSAAGVSLPSPGLGRLLPLGVGAIAFVAIGGFLARQITRDRTRRNARSA